MAENELEAKKSATYDNDYKNVDNLVIPTENIESKVGKLSHNEGFLTRN